MNFRIRRDQQEPLLEVLWEGELLVFGEQKQIYMDAGGCWPVGSDRALWHSKLTKLVRQFVATEYLGQPGYKFLIDRD
jgi:hypothetical protein